MYIVSPVFQFTTITYLFPLKTGGLNFNQIYSVPTYKIAQF